MEGQEKKLTVAKLAELTNTSFVGNGDLIIEGVEALEAAGDFDASFLANPKYRDALSKSRAGLFCVAKNFPHLEGKNFLLCDDPSRVFQQIIEIFLINENNNSGFTGIHPTAVIHPSSTIDDTADIGPYVVIDKNCTVGAHTKIFSHVCIGAGSAIGNSCIIHPHVTIREKSSIGDRVIIQPGAVIGSCGFGYTTDAQGRHTKLDQLGFVELSDDVEVGACTTIDRARFKKTAIAKNTKIDNLVQIGHNVLIGQSNLIVSQTGIAGSTKTGRNVVFGGQTGVVGHIEIGDFVMIASKGGVSKSLPSGGKYSGVPVLPLQEYNRQQVHLRNIEKYVKKIEELEKKIEELKK
jgi:UDP-3-O-[3-hydroxymyristoyl] glucosamine N-acyltransferase